MHKLSSHLWVFQDHINVGVIRDGHRALLIDFGTGAVEKSLREIGIDTIDTVFFTHHHRDQACGVYATAKDGALIGAPAAERQWFTEPETFWNDPQHRWHLFNMRPHHLMLTHAIPVDRELTDGEVIHWGPAKITVLSTPGHTDGSITLLVDVDKRRYAFCGDLLYDSGQLWELHSLQKGMTEPINLTDYHGFLGARGQLTDSLYRLEASGPDIVIPSHGAILREPAIAVETLLDRLQTCYDRYVAISALRHYFPEMFADYAERTDLMPIRAGIPAPGCLRHVLTSWILLSESGAAFVMDCCGVAVIEALQTMLAAGEITSIEGVWITHYHYDHVDAVPEFQQTFDCELIADEYVARVIADPLAWRLPCSSPCVARVDRRTTDGESWQWREFTLTAYHFPGQTLYHGGLLVEGRGLRLFFAGDSFTAAGIDDYCAQNRNFLGPGVGFQRCLDILERLAPELIFNAHVDDAFSFTPEEIRFMRENLTAREELYGGLFPWDHPNFGMDDFWVRCHPYEQVARRGDTVTVDVVITNHSKDDRPVTCRAMTPLDWGLHASRAREGIITAKSEGTLRLTITLPEGLDSTRIAIPVDVTWDGRYLPQFTELILAVE
ncbi:MAG: MBL fold metallo-hydrolase [Armatimonadota bacterium]